MGSSPEIHLVEAHPQRQHGNSHFMRRAQSNFRNQRTANLSDEKVSQRVLHGYYGTILHLHFYHNIFD